MQDVKPSEEPGIQRMQSAQPDAEKADWQNSARLECLGQSVLAFTCEYGPA